MDVNGKNKINQAQSKLTGITSKKNADKTQKNMKKVAIPKDGQTYLGVLLITQTLWNNRSSIMQQNR